MLFIKKINLKRYLFLTGFTTFLACLFVKNLNELYGILIVYLATIINHMMLVEVTSFLTQAGKGEPVDKLQMVTLFIGKFFVLIIGIYLGWHFMADRVFIPMLNYVLQIFLLINCFNKESKIE